MAELIFLRRGEELMRVALDRRQTTIGRGPQNDVAIPDVSVSRNQASIEQRGTAFFMVDRSGRGTDVDGTLQTELHLKQGAELLLGDWRARFHSERQAGDGATTQAHPRSDRTEAQSHPLLGQGGPYQLRIRGAGAERVLSLETDELTLGKDTENHLVLDDRFVSSFHARLSRTPKGFWLRDLGSTNGSFVAGMRVKETEVAPGTPIRLGETELCIERVPQAREGAGGFEGMVGNDASMEQVFALVDRLAPTQVSVLIQGESGTGKELVARALHRRSNRSDQPFVPVNCAAVSSSLLESELFGHEKGAFTGADRQRAGAFEEAHKGTLFLDELGEMPLEMQAKLLRVLESGEVRRVGASKAIHVDVRVVGATHKDLFSMIKQGKFREDLFYRLCVFPLMLPPLRRRGSDLHAVADHLIRMQVQPPTAEVTLSAAARAKLAEHPFTGNIRELKNVMQRALLLRRGNVIEVDNLVFDAPLAADSATPREAVDDPEHLYLPGRSMADCEREIIARAVTRSGGNKTAAAKELGISRSTIIKRTEPDAAS
jgi:DNA-binding NtrC family response regulator/pSer/pThr/pTyr-binding forkhead associated (FHA) protein